MSCGEIGPGRAPPPRLARTEGGRGPAARATRALEAMACGTDYGADGYTTPAQADRMAAWAALGPGARLLDLGTGAGWPGLYLAERTGCSVVLCDTERDGLTEAGRGARARRITPRVAVVAARGSALPLRPGSMDAVLHGDVLCCLPDKEAVLRATRGVLRIGGRSVFTVIHPAVGLGPAARARAVAVGPPWCDVHLPYGQIVEQAGFDEVEVHDVTAEYLQVARRKLCATLALTDLLVRWLGKAKVAEDLARRRRAVVAIEGGDLRRSLIVGVRR